MNTKTDDIVYGSAEIIDSKSRSLDGTWDALPHGQSTQVSGTDMAEKIREVQERQARQARIMAAAEAKRQRKAAKRLKEFRGKMADISAEEIRKETDQ